MTMARNSSLAMKALLSRQIILFAPPTALTRKRSPTSLILRRSCAALPSSLLPTSADGVQLSFTLYLPANYKQGERLPTIVWAYPLEFNDASTAGQVSGSPYHFT